MAQAEAGPGRLGAFSDGVIAVIITIMVLELRAPHDASLTSLLVLWPTFVSYLLSYLFLAVVWANHHHLLSYLPHANARVIWANFCFLFFVSLIPFFTEYMAATHMNSFATAVYASLFLLITLAFMFLQRVIFGRHRRELKLEAMARGGRRRNWVALVLYGLAVPAAYVHPAISLAIIVGIAGLYFIPEPANWVAGNHPTK